MRGFQGALLLRQFRPVPSRNRIKIQPVIVDEAEALTDDIDAKTLEFQPFYKLTRAFKQDTVAFA